MDNETAVSEMTVSIVYSSMCELGKHLGKNLERT